MGFGGGFFSPFHLYYQKRPSSRNGIAEDVDNKTAVLTAIRGRAML